MDKKSLDKYSSVYPTYLPKKVGHFGFKVCFISIVSEPIKIVVGVVVIDVVFA